jgi:hypothetical protein
MDGSNTMERNSTIGWAGNSEVRLQAVRILHTEDMDTIVDQTRAFICLFRVWMTQLLLGSEG